MLMPTTYPVFRGYNVILDNTEDIFDDEFEISFIEPLDLLL